jgi:hypothetical protein
MAAFLAVAPPASAETALAAPADLKDAQARLARATTTVEYAAMLDSFSSALAPPDALALLDQGLARTEGAPRAKLLVKAGDLDLLVGLFGDAAARYEAAAAPKTGADDKALLLRAARCYIASGDSEKAASLSADLLAAGAGPELAASARLVGAWALAMQGRRSDSALLASTVASSPTSGAGAIPASSRREAEFLQWLCADQGAKAAAAGILAAEFPGSPEALIASGSASAPPLPHWYLGGLGSMQEIKRPEKAPQSPSSLPAPAAVAATPAVAPSPEAAAPNAGTPSTSRGKRLQVGYFSRQDNAQALKDELASKGFAAAVEPRTRQTRSAAGSASSAERWIVVVDGGKDLARTAQSLKDAGYESYLVD